MASALNRPIHPLDIPFDRVPVGAQSSGGQPYTRWMTTGMPQLGQYQYLLDIVFFLYPDEESARQGKDAGGTGFFVALPSEFAPDHFHHGYAVTNWHVAVSGGNSVIRVNRRDGGIEIFDFEPHEWEFVPGGHDVAVIPIDMNPNELQVEGILAPSFFLTKQQIKEYEVNAGEDVFMLGRFVDYDGRDQRNQPAMRFGNISMMEASVNLEERPLPLPPSLVVDMHSRTGFSGSPVFVYRTSGSVFPKEDTILIKGHMMNLLGILWGQFPEAWDINDPSAPPRLDGKKTTVKGMSGMSVVAPASAIWDALHTPRLRELRTAKEADLKAQLSAAPINQTGVSPGE